MGLISTFTFIATSKGMALTHTPVTRVLCRGVATISGLCIYRQDTPAGSQQQECKSADPQPHVLRVWPECAPCEDPLLQPALQLAEPVNRLPLQLSVLPSNMPAELLMTYQEEVRVPRACRPLVLA